MSEASVTIRTFKCDGPRCTMEDETKDRWNPPAGWLHLLTYNYDGSAQKPQHLCPECAKDLKEVYPLK